MSVTAFTNYNTGWRDSHIIGGDTETRPISHKHGNFPPVACLTLAGHIGTANFAAFAAQKGAMVRWEGSSWSMLADTTLPLGELMRAAAEAADVLPFHNLAFDWGIIVKEGWLEPGYAMDLVEQGKFRCTQIRETLLAVALDRFNWDPRRKAKTSFALAALSEVYLGKDRWGGKSQLDLHGNVTKGDPDSWRHRYGELIGVPWQQWPEEAIEYALEDAIDARDILPRQGQYQCLPEGELVSVEGNVTNERAQTEASIPLTQIQNHLTAKHIRESAVDALDEEVTAAMLAAQEWGVKGGFIRINKCKTCEGTGRVGTPPQMRVCPTCKGDPNYMAPRQRVKLAKRALHKGRLQMWIKAALGEATPMTDPSKKFPQGQVSTAEDTMRLTGVPLLINYADGEKAKKDKTTYVPILRSGLEGRIIPRFNTLVRTGRSSCVKPNLQNPTARQGFRECFEARPGYVFASIDYKTVEMCTLAQTCLDWFGYSVMAEAINQNQDLHLAFACWMLGISYEEGARRLEQGDPEVKKMRKLAKVANFGFPGGLGAKGFVTYAEGWGLTLTYDEAKQLKERWLQAWPELDPYFKRIKRWSRNGVPTKMKDGEMVNLFTVHQEPTGRLRGGAYYTSACNTLFQGRAADLGKAALWHMLRETLATPDSVMNGVKMWCFIHDEILFEGPELTAHLWAQRAVEVMQAAGQPFLPGVQLRAIPALSYGWSKMAEPEYRDGTLVPYEPAEARRAWGRLQKLKARAAAGEEVKGLDKAQKTFDYLNDVCTRRVPNWSM